MLMKRITGSGVSWELPSDFKSTWTMAVRLKQIEDILGEDYDLDRLKELVEADREGQCVVLSEPMKPMIFRPNDTDVYCPNCGQTLSGG